MVDAKAFWDKAAKRYAQSPIRDMDGYNYTLDRTRSYLTPTDQALELGCGTGGTARLLAAHLGHITGTDISPEMIRIAKARAAEDGIENAEFTTADLEANLPQGGPYDVVMAHNLLHLLPQTKQAIERITPMVKSGGLFISKTPCLAQRDIGWKIRLMLRFIPLLQWAGKAPYVNLLTHAQLEEMITNADFSIIETSSYPKEALGRYIVARRN